MSKAPILVCALADAPLVVPGSIFDHRCTNCGRAVMIAPSGQRIMRDQFVVTILCEACFTATHDDIIEAAASAEELRREARSSRPNYRRYRN